MHKTCSYKYIVGPRNGQSCGRLLRRDTSFCYEHKKYNPEETKYVKKIAEKEDKPLVIASDPIPMKSVPKVSQDPKKILPKKELAKSPKEPPKVIQLKIEKPIPKPRHQEKKISVSSSSDSGSDCSTCSSGSYSDSDSSSYESSTESR